MANRPTLLNSCASAATAAEARFRIDAAPQVARSTRVVALDEQASVITSDLAEYPWRAARFFSYDPQSDPQGSGADLVDVALVASDGRRVLLSEELDDADFVMMIATVDAGAAAASAIGDACALRDITTAGLIFGEDRSVAAAVTALRPYARVLLVSGDRFDAFGLLSAVGA